MLSIQKRLIQELCIELYNCADCVDEITKKCDCSFAKQINQLAVSNITSDSFELDGIYDEKVTQKLKNIANSLGYNLMITGEVTKSYLKE